MVIAATVAVIGLLGGSMVVELPADKKVKAMEIQFAQTWQQREAWQQQQQVYHKQREVEEIQFRLRYISNEINRINQIPQYLNRSPTPEEEWQIQQYKKEWQLLTERLHNLTGR